MKSLMAALAALFLLSFPVLAEDNVDGMGTLKDVAACAAMDEFQAMYYGEQADRTGDRFLKAELKSMSIQHAKAVDEAVQVTREYMDVHEEAFATHYKGPEQVLKIVSDYEKKGVEELVNMGVKDGGTKPLRFAVHFRPWCESLRTNLMVDLRLAT